MKAAKAKRLQKAGWKVSDASEFLELTVEETAYIEMKLLLSEKLSETRKKQKISQTKLAEMMDSSQSRVAKMESGDPSVSTDLLIKGLLVLGATRKQIAKTLGQSSNAA